MKLEHVSFTPLAEVQFDEREIEVLLLCAKSHYDARCKEAGEMGGFLYGIKNRHAFAPSSPHGLEFDHLDTLAKITEVGVYLADAEAEIAAKVGETIDEILREMVRVTPEAVVGHRCT